MTTRRLAAILAADVVGYSKLIGEDEPGTLAALREKRKGIVNPVLAQHGGRIFKLMGDGLLAEFPSAVQALQAAIGMQKGLRELNAKVTCGKAIGVRIGIHQGDVVVEGRDLLGDGVNIAARLEALAEPGGICISARVHEDAAGKIALQAQDMGDQSLKNIARPVRAYRVSVGSPLTGPKSDVGEPALALPDKPSIAVLPFQNMSGDPEQEYFADGMVEEITTALSRVHSLFVIARNSSFTYRGKAVDVKQVGRELGVRYVLEGSVRRADERIRISAQLVEAETGVHLWAHRYDSRLDDIFALQDEITLSVVGAIEPSLRDAEIERVKRKRPDNLDAYDLVLRALPHVYVSMPEEAAKAVPLLEQALALEADYAGAHGLLAWCKQFLFIRAGFKETDRIAAVRHARAAVTHGRDDATAMALGAFVIGLVEHDRAAAREAFERALALSPSCAFALFLGGIFLAWTGDAELAIEWAERALRVSPVDRFAFGGHQAVAIGNFILGQYEEAATAARRAVLSNSSFSVTQSLLAAALAKLGRTAEAKAAARQVLVLQPSFSSSGYCNAIGITPSLAATLMEAWHQAGLPP
jgi:TolB-like protein/class 3 adenylate cyclase/Flp pilus assembly protein TadD